jgi:hypothetical protein
MNYSKFDELFDIDGLKKDLEEAKNNKYDEVPCGEYECHICKMELTETKKGEPMLTVWFEILQGDYKKQKIFMNQVISKGFQIHVCNEFLRSLDSGLDITFDSFKQYGKLIDDVYFAVKDLEFALEYGEKKGYKTFTITEIFEVGNPL